jgi:excisionase family DNA binding protein
MAQPRGSGGASTAWKAETPHTVPNEEHATILSGLPPLLTIDEAAAILRLSPGRCRLACREGRIPAVQIGAQWRVPRARLEALVAGDAQ